MNLYGRVSDPLDCPWDEGWEKPLKPWEPSLLKARRSQISLGNRMRDLFYQKEKGYSRFNDKIKYF